MHYTGGFFWWFKIQVYSIILLTRHELETPFVSYVWLNGFHWNSKQVDGNLTQNENLADIAGLQVAFSAYRKYRLAASKEDLKAERRIPGLVLTLEQAYFLTVAQVRFFMYFHLLQTVRFISLDPTFLQKKSLFIIFFSLFPSHIQL